NSMAGGQGISDRSRESGEVKLKLAELAKHLEPSLAAGLGGKWEVDAVDVTHDSRQSGPGIVFVAIRGEVTDGNQFVAAAVAGGAAAIVSEQPAPPDAGAPWIQVRNARAALAQASAAVHDHPSRKLKLGGITGTNGKTTTAHLVDSIIREAEGVSAMLGTITYRIGAESAEAHHTMPESSDIQRFLARALRAGCRSAALEVSSHGIELNRADELSFAAAVFTNLTRDHLDYHKTMEAYFGAKKKLFDGSLGAVPKCCIVNIDDEYGRRLAELARGTVVTYGLRAGDVKAEEFVLGPTGIEMTARLSDGSTHLSSPLVGRPHVYNILAAAATGMALGFDSPVIARGISRCPIVPGRFEQVTLGQPSKVNFRVVVDYAHTDDALKNVLQTAREIVRKRGRVITVFGCGGDRDRSKRAPMGEAAGRLSDVVIVTSDNPRSEDSEAIIRDIEPGIETSGRPYVKVLDRRQAIFRAIEEARSGDVVVIAGKGHETYQIIGGLKAHFDDREVARDALSQRALRENRS
ncbi:MAG TPA: UDP-N-acetylmuramoyl-L-alanyl-D-glutamate--2,6-diaminopimelate ligase, partial [Blastocatellia bacterium]|nr:UDP-N-acetylmuramoyl-L-alanyl-D-glutamate--2,6-diaminopimelate ligase [Blastocatellia bacterium]